MMESRQYIKKQEKNDANNVLMRGHLYSLFPAVILIYTGHSNIVVLIIGLLLLLLIKNYVDIYVKYTDKYKTGNSYLKRKFRTIGLMVTIYDYCAIYILYLINLYDSQIALIFYTSTLILLFLTSGLLVNKLWFNFDLKRYREIDLKNPKQKRYTTQ